MPSLNALLNPNRIDGPYKNSVALAATAVPNPLQRLKAMTAFNASRLEVALPEGLVRYRPVVHYFSDNGGYDDTASSEICRSLHNAKSLLHTLAPCRGVGIHYHNIPSQDVNAAAFDLAQNARDDERGFGNIFFMNCAPRKDQRGKETLNGGEKVYAGILPNGGIIAGTGPAVFVHFKDLVEAGELNLYLVNVATNGSQFRSRDYFPWLSVIIAHYINRPCVNARWRPGLAVQERDALLLGVKAMNDGVTLTADDIPSVPNGGCVAVRVDTHGNIKLAVRHANIVRALKPFGKEVVVFGNERVLRATLTNHSFDLEDGKTAISGGSSGKWVGANGRELPPLAEIFTVDRRAQDRLGMTDENLKRGVDIHFIPSALFEESKKQLAAMGKTCTEARLAESLVSSGLVHGLNFGNLISALSSKNLPSYVPTRAPNLRRNNLAPLPALEIGKSSS